MRVSKCDLVVELYGRGVSSNSIGCIGDYTTVRASRQARFVDEIEVGFTSLTTKGELKAATQCHLDRMLVIVLLEDLGHTLSI